MSTMGQDLRYALRTLRHTPAFTALVVLTLGLGIGANTAIFSLMDQVLLRSLPVAHPEQLVQLDGPGPFSGRTEGDQTFSYPMYRDLRDGNQVLDGLVARYGTPGTIVAGGQSERVEIELVSGNMFGVLGVVPAIGRAITADDDVTPGGHPVMVLSHGYWRRRFAADPSIVGQVFTLNDTAMTVIGVAPAGFTGVVGVAQPDVFVPLTMKAAATPTWDDLEDRRTRWLSLVGRLKPGVSIEAAKAQLDVVFRQANEQELVAVPAFAQASATFKERFRAKTMLVTPAARGLSDVRGQFSTALVVLMGMVGLVLLIACANVANLLLTRATARQREMAVRLALGASRGRLIRLTMTESLLLAGAGGVVGVLIAMWLGDLLVATLPSDSWSRSLSTTPDVRLGLFAMAVTLGTAIVFGLAPAFQSASLSLNQAMRDEAASVAGGSSQARVRHGLVVVQVALSMLLVAGGGLFARSLYNLQHLDRGFDAEQLFSFAVDPSLSGYDQTRLRHFSDDLVGRLRQEPGVVGAAVGRIAVLTGDMWRRTIEVQGYERKPDEDMSPQTNEVSPGYFQTMRIPLVAGRDFTERDAEGAPRVAVVNETFARYFFGSDNPIGRRVGWSARRDPGAIEIVGVVKDSFYDEVPGQGARAETPRFIFTPFQQGERLAEFTVYVRATEAAARSLPARLRELVGRADRTLPVFNLQPVQTTVDDALFAQRMLALLSAAFGLLATILAAVGIYGVMSYTVSRRTREIGVRIALGAARTDVVWMVLREVALLTLIGIGLGVPSSMALSRLAESQLFGISPSDPLTLAAAALVLALVAALAGWLPARRAANTEPMMALRFE